MAVTTHNTEIESEVRVALQLLRSRHHMGCATCQSSGNCELQVKTAARLQPPATDARRPPLTLLPDLPVPAPTLFFKDLLAEYDVNDSQFFPYMPRMRADAEASHLVEPSSTTHSPKPPHPRDTSSPAVHFDLDKCVLCTRCVRACSELQVRMWVPRASEQPEETKSTTFAQRSNAASPLL
jgi:predicted molibdopterin-dependent oxidoreductase YjgC